MELPLKSATLTSSLDPSVIPGDELDPEAIAQAATDLRTAAERVRERGAQVARSWQGLRECYQAPESEALLRVMGPVRSQASGLADDVETVAGALDQLAEDLREVKDQFLEAKGSALALRMKCRHDPSMEVALDLGPWEPQVRVGGWRDDPELVEWNNSLLRDLDAIQAERVEAERRCANAIAAIDGLQLGGVNDPNRWRWGGGETGAPAAEQPWGPEVERTYGPLLDLALSSWRGMWDDVVVAGAEDMWGFVPFSEKGWDPQKSIDTFTGLKGLLGFGTDGEHSWDVMGDTWLGMVQDFVGWEYWETDPMRALQRTSVNVGLCFLGGAGIVKTVAGVGKAARLGRVLPDSVRSKLDVDKAARMADYAEVALDPVGAAVGAAAGLVVNAGFQGVKGLLNGLDLAGPGNGNGPAPGNDGMAGAELPTAVDAGSGRLSDPARIPDADHAGTVVPPRDSAGAVDDNPLPPSTDAPEPVNSPVKVGNDGGPSWYEEVLEARRERADAQARARAELLAARQVPAGQVPPGSVFAGGDSIVTGAGGRSAESVASGGTGATGTGSGPGAGSGQGSDAIPSGDVFGGRTRGSTLDAGGTGDVSLSPDLDVRQPVPHGPEVFQEGNGARVDDSGAGPSPAETSGDGGPRPPGSDGPGGEFDELGAQTRAEDTGAASSGPGPAPDSIAWRSGGDGAGDVSLTRSQKTTADEFLSGARRTDTVLSLVLEDIVADRPSVRISESGSRVMSASELYRDLATGLRRDPRASPDALVVDTYDAVRVRALIDPDEFADSTRGVMDDLVEQGYRPVGTIKNGFDGRGGPGITTHWMAPGGKVVQIEFHTPDSLAARTELDGLLEQWRDPVATTQHKQVLEDRMFDLLRRPSPDTPDGVSGLEWPDRARPPADPHSEWADGTLAAQRATAVPGGSRLALTADSMSPDQRWHYLRDVLPEILEINYGRHTTGQPGFDQNCTHAALAADLALDGKYAVAGPSSSARPITDLSNHLGGTWHQANNPDAIIDRINHLGDNARGIIATRNPDGTTGHVINIVKPPGHPPILIDPQTGDLARISPGHDLYYLETHPGTHTPNPTDLGETSPPGLTPLTNDHLHTIEATGQQPDVEGPDLGKEVSPVDQAAGSGSVVRVKPENVKEDGGWSIKKGDLWLSRSEKTVVDHFHATNIEVQYHFTQTMNDVAEKHGLPEPRVENLVEKPTDLYRNVGSELQTRPSANLHHLLAAKTELVRYSYTIKPEDFSGTSQAVMDDLARRGFRPAGDPIPGPSGYGAVSQWTDGADRKIEVEFHTPNSLNEAAEARQIVNAMSNDDVRTDRLAELQERLDEIRKNSPAPVGVDDLRKPEVPQSPGSASEPMNGASRMEAPGQVDSRWTERRFAPPVFEGDAIEVSAPDPEVAFSARTDLEANTCYEVEGRGTFYTNGTGKISYVQSFYGPEGKLNPDLQNPVGDAIYEVIRREGDTDSVRHIFRTDGLGRTTEAYAPRLKYDPTMHRDEAFQKSVGHRAGKGNGYDGGHLLPRELGGGPEEINMMTQDSDHNRRNRSLPENFRKLEESMVKLVKPSGDVTGAGAEVHYRVRPVYDGGGRIPVRYTVEYTIDGVTMPTKEFSNVREASGGAAGGADP